MASWSKLTTPYCMTEELENEPPTIDLHDPLSDSTQHQICLPVLVLTERDAEVLRQAFEEEQQESDGYLTNDGARKVIRRLMRYKGVLQDEPEGWGTVIVDRHGKRWIRAGRSDMPWITEGDQVRLQAWKHLAHPVEIERSYS